MGDMSVSVEGIKSIDIEYSVFSKDKQFLGAVSILIKHVEMIRSIAETIEKDLGVKHWAIQKDGHILYETDPTKTVLNIFADPPYKDYPELIALGKLIIKEKEGEGFSSFLDSGTKNVVKKRAVWKTVHFCNNDWIIVTYN